MLDLIISYINFIILTISLIVKKFTFVPPNPPNYIIKQEKKGSYKIIFCIDGKIKLPNLLFPEVVYKLYIINDYLPILVFTPFINNNICIIYSHGNCGDLGTCIKEYADIATNTNCTLVSYEYPGYGMCKGQEASESQCVKNIKLTYKFARENLGFNSNQIILYGYSLGTGISFDLACDKNFPILGLILQSPYLSIMRILYEINKTKYFDLFNNCDKAKYLNTKTLFIHGNNDNVIPYIHGRILAKIIPEKCNYKFITVDKANHNNMIIINKDLLFNSINNFIRDLIEKSMDNSNDYIKEKYEDHPLDNFESNSKADITQNSDGYYKLTRCEGKRNFLINLKGNIADKFPLKKKDRYYEKINNDIVINLPTRRPNDELENLKVDNNCCPNYSVNNFHSQIPPFPICNYNQQIKSTPEINKFIVNYYINNNHDYNDINSEINL